VEKIHGDEKPVGSDRIFVWKMRVERTTQVYNFSAVDRPQSHLAGAKLNFLWGKFKITLFCD
jgi:hypothetical protein